MQKSVSEQTLRQTSKWIGYSGRRLISLKNKSNKYHYNHYITKFMYRSSTLLDLTVVRISACPRSISSVRAWSWPGLLRLDPCLFIALAEMAPCSSHVKLCLCSAHRSMNTTHVRTHKCNHVHAHIHTGFQFLPHIYYTVHPESIHSLIPKWNKFFFFLKILQTTPHNDNI